MQHIKFLAILFLLSSCIEIEFKHPMPPNGTTLTHIPEDIAAYFKGLEKDSSGKDKLDFNEYNVDFDWNEPLPEGIILKKWKGSYFLNQQVDSLWQIIMLTQDKKNKAFNVYRLDGSNDATIVKLKSITTVKEVFDADGDLDRVILDPSGKEFKKMIKSGIFEQIDLFED